MRKLNVAIIIGRFPPDVLSGAELQAQQLAAELAKIGHKVTVFTRRYDHRPYRENKDGYLIRRRDELPFPVLRTVSDIVPAVWQIAHQRPCIDVLLCYQALNSGIIGSVAQALLRIPMILSVRSSAEFQVSQSLIKRLVVLPVYKFARQVIVQSTHIFQNLIEQIQLAGKEKFADQILSKVTVIANGINLEHFQRSRGNKVIYVGRLIEGKGVADLIHAMKELPGHELIIVGDGPERKSLELMSQGMAVKFTGQVMPNQVREYLQEARLLVLPASHSEGFPNVIMEAMACGIPVIATPVGGVPDLVQHSKTGFLIEIGDINKIAFYIKSLLEDDGLWEQLSENSSQAIQPLAWVNITPQVEHLLFKVVENVD